MDASQERKGKHLREMEKDFIPFEKFGADKKFKQIFVRKDLRKKVIKVSHDIMLVAHIGVKKTNNQILYLRIENE